MLFLRNNNDKKRGSWSEHPGVTAIVLRAFGGAPEDYTKDDGMTLKVASKYLLEMQAS